MRLTNSVSSSTSTFKLIETALNRLHVASVSEADGSSDTASFLLRRMDVEAAGLETDTLLRATSRHLKAELENRGVQCTAYRFHKGGEFGGYTLCLRGLLENDKPIGAAYVHTRRDGVGVVASTSLFYTSPYKARKWVAISKGSVDGVWRTLDMLGYEKPTANLLELDVTAFIAREDVHASAKCVDLKVGASLEIAERIRRTLKRTYRTAEVVEHNNRYSVIAKHPKSQ